MMNTGLIVQVGGIERAREILEGAPDGATHINQSPNYFKNIKHKDCEMWNSYNQSWFDTDVFSFDIFITLGDLRTAIAKHEQGNNPSELDVLEMIHVSPSCVVIDL